MFCGDYVFYYDYGKNFQGKKLTNVLAEALLWLKDEGYLGII